MRRSYLDRLGDAIASIDVAAIDGFVGVLSRARTDRACVFLAGNGGSASTASHMATDLGPGSQRLTGGVRAISLVDNPSILSAIGNDLSFKEVFSAQLDLLGAPGDVFVAISASGNSENLLHAVDTAKDKSIFVVSLTGFDGGKLARESDLNIHVKTEIGDYGPTEDAHLAINHIVAEHLRTVHV